MESSWVGDVVASQSSSPTMVSLVGDVRPPHVHDRSQTASFVAGEPPPGPLTVAPRALVALRHEREEAHCPSDSRPHLRDGADRDSEPRQDRPAERLAGGLDHVAHRRRVRAPRARVRCRDVAAAVQELRTEGVAEALRGPTLRGWFSSARARTRVVLVGRAFARYAPNSHHRRWDRSATGSRAGERA